MPELRVGDRVSWGGDRIWRVEQVRTERTLVSVVDDVDDKTYTFWLDEDPPTHIGRYAS